MTSISTAEHGWSYLNAVIDCCTREITAWTLDVRCRQQEATSVLEQAVTNRSVEPGTLVLGSDKRDRPHQAPRSGREKRAEKAVPTVPSYRASFSAWSRLARVWGPVSFATMRPRASRANVVGSPAMP